MEPVPEGCNRGNYESTARERQLKITNYKLQINGKKAIGKLRVKIIS